MSIPDMRANMPIIVAVGIHVTGKTTRLIEIRLNSGDTIRFDSHVVYPIYGE